MALVDDQTSKGETWNVALSFSFELHGHCSPNPMLLCGRIVLVAGFPPVFYPQNFGAQRLRSWRSLTLLNDTLALDPFFPEFCMLWMNGALWRMCTVRHLIPKTLCSSVESTWISAALYILEYATQIVLTCLVKKRLPILLPPLFFWLFTGLAVSLNASECSTFVAEFASRFCFAVLTYGRTLNNHTTVSPSFLWGLLCAVFDMSFLMDCCTQEALPFESPLPLILCLLISEQERTILFSFHAHCRRDGNCKHLLLNTVLCLAFHWYAVLLCLLSTLTAFLTFLSFNQYTCFNSCISDIEVPFPDHLINVSDDSPSIDIERFLVHTWPILEVAHTLVLTSCTNLYQNTTCFLRNSTS